MIHMFIPFHRGLALKSGFAIQFQWWLHVDSLIHGKLTSQKAEHWNEAAKEYGRNQQHVARYPLVI